MDEGLDLDMQTIVPSKEATKTSQELVDKKSNAVLAKPKKKKYEPLARLPQPEESTKLTAKQEQEKEDLSKILEELDKVRLDLTDSGGQGYLMNASAIISTYIRNTY